MKRIYVNTEAILKNRESLSADRLDLITIAHIDPDRADDPTDRRQGCDRGAHSYDVGIRVEIEGPSVIVHDPRMQHGASVWIETEAPVVFYRNENPNSRVRVT